MNTIEKNIKIKTCILLSILISAIIGLSSFFVVSLFTYEEFNHVSKNSKLSVINKFQLFNPTENQIFYFLNDNKKDVFNLSITCKLDPSIVGKTYNVETVEFQYKDFFRDGNHTRMKGLREQICIPVQEDI
jgi:hypothetical protein